MAVISIRLNESESRILKQLSEYYEEDNSTLVKKSIFELYENLIDLKQIAKFERNEKAGKIKFHSYENIIKQI